MTGPKRIAVVVGSTRPQRLCRGIADWVLATAARGSPLSYELLDLADIALPFLDEPRMAALGRYEHEHTKRWSRAVSSFDGFIFVMPQYNWGYTAVLKNALDFLYVEWHGKAAGTVTYGSHGGGRGADQLQSVLTALDMRIARTNPRLDTPPDSLSGPGQAGTLDFTPFEASVETLNLELIDLVATTEA